MESDGKTVRVAARDGKIACEEEKRNEEHGARRLHVHLSCHTLARLFLSLFVAPFSSLFVSLAYMYVYLWGTSLAAYRCFSLKEPPSASRPLCSRYQQRCCRFPSCLLQHMSPPRRPSFSLGVSQLCFLCVSFSFFHSPRSPLCSCLSASVCLLSLSLSLSHSHFLSPFCLKPSVTPSRVFILYLSCIQAHSLLARIALSVSVRLYPPRDALCLIHLGRQGTVAARGCQPRFV